MALSRTANSNYQLSMGMGYQFTNPSYRVELNIMYMQPHDTCLLASFVSHSTRTLSTLA